MSIEVNRARIEQLNEGSAIRHAAAQQLLAAADVVYNPAQRTGYEAVLGGQLCVVVGRNLMRVPSAFGTLLPQHTKR